MDNSKISFKDMLAELSKINEWFQQGDADLDEGLEKLKRGKLLITECKSRLESVENEFIEISNELEEKFDDDKILRKTSEVKVDKDSTKTEDSATLF